MGTNPCPHCSSSIGEDEIICPFCNKSIFPFDDGEDSEMETVVEEEKKEINPKEFPFNIGDVLKFADVESVPKSLKRRKLSDQFVVTKMKKLTLYGDTYQAIKVDQSRFWYDHSYFVKIST